jgi:hypothetical protein
MPENAEIITDIRNKLQTSCLIVERTAEGRSVPGRFVDLAINDLMEVEKLLSKLEKSI